MRNYRFALAAAVLFLVCVVVGKAKAHDIYGGVRSPTGQLCCGGDPKTGDCEAVNYRMSADGSAWFVSNRYKAVVHVGASTIVWEPIPGSPEEAHWCGVPRSRVHPNAPLDESNPDKEYWTYCAFIAPGGT
jgi:hypothetical protein